MRYLRYFLCLGFATFLLAYDSYGQWEIAEDEQLYRIRVWRRIDLREKQNKGFFSQGREVTKFILDGINSGQIQKLYFDDEFKEEMSPSDFLTGITKKEAAAVNPWDNLVSYNFGEYVSYNGKTYSSIQGGNVGMIPDDPMNLNIFWSEVQAADLEASRFEATEFSSIVVIEDVIFDKRRSRLYYDIQGLQLWVDGAILSTLGRGTDDAPFGVVDYDELEELFRNTPEAKWVNRYNPKEWKNFADAFLLRLFSGPIVKYENPDGFNIADMFPNHYDAVEEIYRYEMFLMEKEHNLWEY